MAICVQGTQFHVQEIRWRIRRWMHAFMLGTPISDPRMVHQKLRVSEC